MLGYRRTSLAECTSFDVWAMEIKEIGRMWWRTPVILERTRQGDPHQFEASLVYLVIKFQAIQGYLVRPYLKEETISLHFSFVEIVV